LCKCPALFFKEEHRAPETQVLGAFVWVFEFSEILPEDQGI